MSRRVPRSRITQDRWLVSYADFITLLFGLFVVLFAFAKADQKKQAQVTQSIDTAFRSFGIFPNSAPQSSTGSAPGSDRAAIPANAVMGEDVLSPAMVKGDLDRIRRELEQTLSSQVATNSVSIHMGRDGLVISLREAGFFASGSATPSPATLATLRQIVASLGHSPYDVRIEGHTDNIPIHTAEFDSNWELSTARATRMARLFLELKALPPERISAAGYAEFHPIATNETAEGRAENRRVDLVVLPRTRIDLSLPVVSRPGVSRSTDVWRKITDEN
jgi:chemotaxis protein MotB